jgi:uncharacterized membrane protein
MNSLEVSPFAAFVACGLVTATLRMAGFWLMGFVPISPRVSRMLQALPGCVVTATIVPLAVRGGPAVALAMVAGVVVMLLRRNDFLAVLAGMAVAAALRASGWAS